MGNKITLKHSELREFIRESIKRHIATLSEVRYIDVDGKNKKDRHQMYRQEPLRNDETIRVYHGCGSLEDAIMIARYGTSGKDFHARKYSYEHGMNPHGIFVTVSPNKFPEFASGYKIRAALEFSCKVKDLDFPVWNGQNSYFVQGSNPQPFTNKSERDIQKQSYRNNAEQGNTPSYVKYSDNPALANSLMNSYEFQALYVGDLNSNMIKRIWVQEGNTSNHWEKYSVKEFLRKYGNREIPDYIKQAHNYPSNRLYKPNEDFTTIEDAARRLEDDPNYLQSTVEELEHAFSNPQLYARDIRGLFWPKQIIQYKGEDYFREYFSRFYENPEYSQWMDGNRQERPENYIQTIQAAQARIKEGFSIIFDSNGNGQHEMSKSNAENVLKELQNTQRFLYDLFEFYGKRDFSLADARQIYINSKNTDYRAAAVELYQTISNGGTYLDMARSISDDIKHIKSELYNKQEVRVKDIQIDNDEVTVTWQHLSINDWGCSENEKITTEQFNINSPKAKTFAMKLQKNQDFNSWRVYSNNI